jgi:transposase
MSKVHRSFSLEFKRAALARLSAGELVSKLAVEFGVHRQLIYKWRDAERADRLGRRRGRPSKAEALAREAGLAEANELALARRRVAELERKVGRQAIELDFFGISRNTGGLTGAHPRPQSYSRWQPQQKLFPRPKTRTRRNPSTGPPRINALRDLILQGKVGALGAIRTPDPQIRSLMLYPAELRARTAFAGEGAEPSRDGRRIQGAVNDRH